MNIQNTQPQQNRIQVIRAEVTQAQQSLEAVSPQDAFDYSEGRMVDHPFAEYSRGELGKAFWSDSPTRVQVTSQDGKIELNSHTFPKDSTGFKRFAASLAAHVGMASMAVTGLGAGMVAWGWKNAVDGPGEQIVTRTEKIGEGKLKETIKIDLDGQATYSSQQVSS